MMFAHKPKRLETSLIYHSHVDNALDILHNGITCWVKSRKIDMQTKLGGLSELQEAA